MKKLTDSKPFRIALSILFSFVLWIYVTGTVTDEITRTFTGIPVELLGEEYLQESKNMTITGLNTNTVSVAISGPRRIVSGLSADKLSAQVDVSKLSQTAYATMQYTISYPNGTDTSSLTVSRKVPESLNFVVSKMIEKEVPVRGSFNGNVAEGFTAEAPVFEPSTIIVSGAENEVNKVSYAWVNFGAEDVTSTYREDATFTLNDSDDNVIANDGIACSTDVISATLPILMVKDVSLSVNLVNDGGVTEDNINISIEPEKISVAGDSSVLNVLNKISLATVDLSTIENSMEQTFTIPLDNDLTNLSGETEAKVKIELFGLTTKAFKVSSFETLNVTEGYKATVKTGPFSVKLRGTEEALAKINESELKAVADLTDYDKTTGEQVVAVKIIVGDDANVGVIGTYTISILLERI